MRSALWILAVPLVCCWLLIQWRVDGPSTAVPADDLWRRTCDGWEKATWLEPDPGPLNHALHPSVVAAMMTLLSVTALVAFPHGRPEQASEHDFPGSPWADRAAGGGYSLLHEKGNKPHSFLK